MLVNTTRPAEIKERLDKFIFTVLPGCKAATPTMEDWTRHPASPYKLFGFRAPVLITDDDPVTVIVSFCPELITHQTDYLDEGLLDDYLDGIEFILGRLAQYVIAGDDIEAAVTKVENEFHEKAPHMMSFMTDVWLTVMSKE